MTEDNEWSTGGTPDRDDRDEKEVPEPSEAGRRQREAYWRLLSDYASWVSATPTLTDVFLNTIHLGSRAEKAEDKKSLEAKKMDVVKELVEADIDPATFDVLLANEIDRRLKVRFGVAFLVLTVLFTVASYALIVLDALNGWGISSVAITALVVETPIQFIGLLYIIARNLFPQRATPN